MGSQNPVYFAQMYPGLPTTATPPGLFVPPNILTIPNSMLYSSTGVNNNFSSSGITIKYGGGYSVQAIYTGVINAQASLSGSIDGQNWSALTGTTAVFISASSGAVAGSTGNFLWNVQEANYHFVQFNWNATTGTIGSSGTIRALLMQKEF